MGNLVGSIIESGSQLLQAGMNRRTQFAINQQNHEHDFDVMREQQAMNLSGLASQREYGSPLEQKRRLMRAGVNAFTAQNMISAGDSPAGAPVTPQNTPAQFSPINFSLSSVYDALKHRQEMKHQRGMQDDAQKHASEMTDKELEHQSFMQDVKNVHERTMAYDTFIQDVAKLGLGFKHDLNMQANQFNENQTQRNWQANQNELDRESREFEGGLNRQFEQLKSAQQEALQRDLQKLMIEHQERMKDKDIDFQTRKEEVEFEKWRTPMYEERSPFWVNKTYGETNFRYPKKFDYDDTGVSNPWKKPYTHRF